MLKTPYRYLNTHSCLSDKTLLCDIGKSQNNTAQAYCNCRYRYYSQLLTILQAGKMTFTITLIFIFSITITI